jgi:hypothetical protein
VKCERVGIKDGRDIRIDLVMKSLYWNFAVARRTSSYILKGREIACSSLYIDKLIAFTLW